MGDLGQFLIEGLSPDEEDVFYEVLSGPDQRWLELSWLTQ